MKLTIGLQNGVSYISSVTEELSLNDLIDNINENGGWLVLSNIAFKEEDIFFFELEPETMDEFLDQIKGFYYHDNDEEGDADD